MNELLPILVGLLGVIVTQVVVYVVAKRAKSGSIHTSEAKDLWDELRAELTALRGEVAQFRAENASLRSEMAEIRKRFPA